MHYQTFDVEDQAAASRPNPPRPQLDHYNYLSWMTRLSISAGMGLLALGGYLISYVHDRNELADHAFSHFPSNCLFARRGHNVSSLSSLCTWNGDLVHNLTALSLNSSIISADRCLKKLENGCQTQLGLSFDDGSFLNLVISCCFILGLAMIFALPKALRQSCQTIEEAHTNRYQTYGTS